MRIAVCDDQTDVLEQIAAQVKSVPFAREVIAFDDISALWRSIQDGTRYDAILMDIEWESKNSGIGFASRLYELLPRTGIIYVTGYPLRHFQHVFLVQANLCGFLSKPLDQTLLEKMLGKSLEILRQSEGKKLTINFNGKVFSYYPEDIYYIESNAHTATIITKSESQICYEKLNDLKVRIPDYFAFPHKSYLVNLNHIQRIDKINLILSNGEEIPVSKNKYAEFRNAYFSYIQTII